MLATASSTSELGSRPHSNTHRKHKSSIDIYRQKASIRNFWKIRWNIALDLMARKNVSEEASSHKPGRSV